MKTFNQISQSAVYKADDISVSLTVCGGSYGGGSEVLVVFGFDSYNQEISEEVAQPLRSHGGGDTTPKVMTYQTVTGTLSPGAHPGSYNGQDAYNDLLITGEANENDFVHRGGRNRPDPGRKLF